VCTPLISSVSRPDGRSASVAYQGGEESPGSMEARCRIISGGGDPRDSATESKPPSYATALEGKGEKGAVRAHRVLGNKDGMANPTGSKTE
jgi:hypothetical protein